MAAAGGATAVQVAAAAAATPTTAATDAAPMGTGENGNKSRGDKQNVQVGRSAKCRGRQSSV